MKVFDATSLIAFLSDMRFPEGLVALSKHYTLIVPEGVAAEIKKSPGKELLKDLVNKSVIRLEKINPARVTQIQNDAPQLHQGECEVIAFAESRAGLDKIVLLSDDKLARIKFQHLRFKWTEELLNHMKARAIIDTTLYDKKINELKNSLFYYKGRDK